MKIHFILCAVVVSSLSAFSNGDSLKEIILQNKSLNELPKDIPYASLLSLNVSYNLLKQLPEEISNSKVLEELNLSNNRYVNPELTAHQIRNLNIKRLYFNECDLTYIPLGIGDLKSLQTLSLARNHIEEISKDLVHRLQVSYLNFSDNKISSLPDNFKELDKLSYLNLSNNPCVNQPKTFGQIHELKNLSELIIRGLNHLDALIFSNPNIKTLDISNSSFSSFDPGLNTKYGIEKISAINCNNFDFSSFSALLASSTLKDVELGGDKFNGFSKQGLSPTIEKLSLSGNTLSKFQITNQLSSLKDLRLRFNKIECLDALLDKLEDAGTIKHLDMGSNGVTHLPGKIGKLSSLESLNISGNKINNILPLFSLKQLKELNISGCGLDQKEIEKLKLQLPTTIIINTVSPKLNIAGADQDKESFIADPLKQSSIITKDGTEITIPANSMVYANGKPVTDPVSITYNPFYSLANIAASGINMNYDNGEVISPFRSAGMFEINASVNGTPVELKRGKEIEVKFRSLDKNQSYNYYQYDSIKQSWTETGKDSLSDVPEKQDSVITPRATVFGNFPSMPYTGDYIKYQKIAIQWKGTVDRKTKFSISSPSNNKHNKDTSDKKNYLYEVNVLSARNLNWLVDEEDVAAFKKHCFRDSNAVLTRKHVSKKALRKEKIMSTTRTDVETYLAIAPDKEKDNFIMRFYNDKDTFEFHAYPDYKDRNVSYTQKKVKKLYDAFEKTQKEREEITVLRKDKFRRKYEEFVKEMERQRKAVQEANEKSLAEIRNSKINPKNFEITRVLQLKGFGIYNCDRPMPATNSVWLAANYLDDKDAKVEVSAYSRLSIIDIKTNIAMSPMANRSVQVPANSVLTVVLQNENSVYLGKINTIGLTGRVGRTDIKMSKTTKNFTVADLEKFIETIQ